MVRRYQYSQHDQLSVDQHRVKDSGAIFPADATKTNSNMCDQNPVFFIKHVKGYSNLYGDVCQLFLSKPGGKRLFKSHPISIRYVFPKRVMTHVKAHAQQPRTALQELSVGVQGGYGDPSSL